MNLVFSHHIHLHHTVIFSSLKLLDIQYCIQTQKKWSHFWIKYLSFWVLISLPFSSKPCQFSVETSYLYRIPDPFSFQFGFIQIEIQYRIRRIQKVTHHITETATKCENYSNDEIKGMVTRHFSVFLLVFCLHFARIWVLAFF